MLGELVGGLISGAAKLFGGRAEQKAQAKQAHQNYLNEKEFAQSGIQWKVADAKAAGIHPLAALGASTTSFSPVSVGSSLSESIGGAGQDIGRAIAASASGETRASAASKAAEALALERGSLENELLRAQIASAVGKQGPATPAMPMDDSRYMIPGQGPTVDVRPIKEKKDYEDRPKMKLGGRVVLTDPQTSNVESAEDRYGDEGPMQWFMQAATAWNDLKHNVNQGNMTRRDVVEWLVNQAKWIDRNTKMFGR